MASSYVSKLKSYKLSINFLKRFPEETFKAHEWLVLSSNFLQCEHS